VSSGPLVPLRHRNQHAGRPTLCSSAEHLPYGKGPDGPGARTSYVLSTLYYGLCCVGRATTGLQVGVGVLS
jgi:hypothetical protein